MIPSFPKLNPESVRPQKLFGASDFPFLKNHPRSKELLYDGEYNSKGYFGNEPPKWRLQSQGWKTKQWQALLDFIKDPSNSGLINFTCSGTDIAPGADEHLGPEWVYPVWVLLEFVEMGFITNKYQIDAILKRQKEEEELGKDITEAPELYESPAKTNAKEKGEEFTKEALGAMKATPVTQEPPPVEPFTPEPDLEPDPEFDSEPEEEESEPEIGVTLKEEQAATKVTKTKEKVTASSGAKAKGKTLKGKGSTKAKAKTAKG